MWYAPPWTASIQGLDLGEVYREGHLVLADLQLHAPVVRMLEPHGQEGWRPSARTRAWWTCSATCMWAA